jgi:hypothetical protein
LEQRVQQASLLEMFAHHVPPSIGPMLSKDANDLEAFPHLPFIRRRLTPTTCNSVQECCEKIYWGLPEDKKQVEYFPR